MKCKKCGRQFNGRFCPSCGTPAARGGLGKGYKIAGAVLLGYGIIALPTVALPAFHTAASTGIVSMVVCIGCIFAGVALLKKQKTQDLEFISDLEQQSVTNCAEIPKANTASNFDASKNSVVDDKTNSELSEQKKPDVVLPSKIGNAQMVYHYSGIKIDKLNYNAALEAHESKNWELTAKEENGEIVLFSLGNRIGNVGPERKLMLFDWIKRGDPYKVLLETIDTEKREAYVFLAFYRSAFSRMGNREYTLAKVAKCGTNDRQEVIALLDEGDEIEIVEDVDENGDDIITLDTNFGDIGVLGAKLQKKVSEEGAVACFIDHVDYNEETEKYTPYVRIYW